MSESECCIAGCAHFGTHFHDGRFYCIEHWGEAVGEPPVDYRASTIVPFKCCVNGCNNEGVITEIGTQNHYCIDHAWKVDRPDEAGLRHPLKANWNAEDNLRAHVMGLAVSEKDLWHIRRLTTARGVKLSGGADTLALCKAQVLWDIRTPVNDNLRGDGMCRECAEMYKEIK